MALEKNSLAINFAQGLDLQTDPFQVAPGKFLALKNSVFNQSILQKRNGFGQLTSLPVTTSTNITTFNDNLTAIGSALYAYSSGNEGWVNKGTISPLTLDTLSLVRSNSNQTQGDSVVAPNGFVCTAYTDTLTGSTAYKYVIADVNTGQNIVAPTLITPSSGVVSGSPRVFLLGNNFVIVFSVTIAGDFHLQFIAINYFQPTTVSTAVDITTAYTPTSTVSWDGFVANNALYVAWNGDDVGGAVHVTYIDSTLLQHNTVDFLTEVATLMSVTADVTGSTPVVYVSYYDLATTTGRTIALSAQLVTILAPTTWIATTNLLNVTSVATNGACTIIYETENAYGYGSSVKTNFISRKSVTVAGVVGSAVVILRSLGLASKAVLRNGLTYMLGIFSTTPGVNAIQPTYFFIDASGNILARLAQSNGGNYQTRGLPSLNLLDDVFYFAYFFKDLLIPINKTQGAVVVSGVYAQTGINLGKITPSVTITDSAEIGGNLNLSGGFLWGYDGNVPVESGFHVFPDNILPVGSTTGGLMLAQSYFYQVLYEWTDAQGNIFRSAPSIIQSVTTTGTTSSVTVNVPYLRLTLKTANPVKIVVFRASTAQPTYYQVTSITSPIFNSTGGDSVAVVDTLADTAIVGNSIIYTTGGVVENIPAPATDVMALFKSRLVLIDSEDRNTLWYSKQLLQGAPVEMSDLFTIFVAPTTASEGSTGPMTALGAMDDKLIIFKENAIYYITGNGPDVTGSNNDFSEPIFITSTVGCANQQSIVFTPQGLMFQSNKGIWLLARNLSTQYIGSPVENYNSDLVQSAVNIPGQNEIRFTLQSGITLMYNYFYNQWGTYNGVPAISSTLYQGLHTILDQYGRVFQETIGVYLDGANPVLMGFTTGWINLMGLQGYERAYFFYLLGTYITPHTLSVSIAYDYNPSPQQIVTIRPDNFSPAYGGDSLYGGSGVYGGNPSLEQWRIFFDQQKCQAFQITLQEIYDPSFGVAAGAGLTLSGINMVVGAKSKYPRIKAANTTG